MPIKNLMRVVLPNTGPQLRSPGHDYSLIESTDILSSATSKTDLSQKQDVKLVSRYIFPVISEANRAVTRLWVSKMVEGFFIAAQIHFMGTFHFLPGLAQNAHLRRFLKIIYLGFVGDFMDAMGPMILMTIITLITALLFLGITVKYDATHEMGRIGFVIIRLWHATFYNALIIPTGMFLMTAIGRIGEAFTAINVFFVVCAALCVIYCLFHVFHITCLLSLGPYLYSQSIHMWHPRLHYRMVVFMMIPAGLCIAMKNFPKFFQLIPNLVYILMTPFLVKQHLYDNFMASFLNAFWFSVCVSGALSSVLSIVRIAEGHVIPQVWQFLGPLMVGFIMIGVMNFVILEKRKRIKARMNYPKSGFAKEEKMEMLKDLDIRNEEDALMYLQNGLEGACDMFTDWTLQGYLMKRFPKNDRITIYLTWFTAFFPKEEARFSWFINIASKMVRPPIEIEALYYQLHRVHIFRQSSTSRETTRDFEKVRKLTEQLITNYTNFWRDIANPSITFDSASYNGMTKVRTRADSLWMEVLDKYPNNSRFAKEYSRYLCDARCHFTEAFVWHQKAENLKYGQNFENDHMFQQFIANFPHYMKKNIVDLKSHSHLSTENQTMANSVDQTRSARSLSVVTSEKSLSLSDLNESVDLENEAREAFLPRAQLRMALERAVNQYKSENIQKIWISVAVRFMISLLCSSVAFALVTLLFDDRDRLFHCLASFSKLVQYITLLPSQIVWWWAMAHSPDLQTRSSIADNIGSSVYLVEKFIDFQYGLSSMIYNMSVSGLEAINDMYHELYSQSFKGSEELVKFTQYLSNSYISNVIFDMDPTEYIVFPTEHDSLVTPDYALRCFLNLASVLSLDTVDRDRVKWFVSPDLATAIMFQWKVTDVLSHAVGTLVDFYETQYQLYLTTGKSPYLFEDPEDVPESFGRSSKGTIDVHKSTLRETIPLCIIAFTPFMAMFAIFHSVVYFTVGTQQELESLTAVLRLFPAEECEKAAKRVHALHGGTENDEDTILQNNSTFLFPVWLPSFVSALIITIFIIVMALVAQERVNQINYALQHYTLILELHNQVSSIATDAVLAVFIRMLSNTEFKTNPVKKNGEIVKGAPAWIDVDDVLVHMADGFKKQRIIYNIVHFGSKSIPPLFGTSPGIDSVLFTPLCQPDVNTKYALDYYKCLSLDHTLNYLVQKSKEVMSSPELFMMNSSHILDIGFILDSTMSVGFNNIYKEYANVYDTERNSLIILSWTFLAIAIIACFGAFIFDYLSIRRIQSIIETFKDLLTRVDPVAFVSNDKVVALVFGKLHQIESKIRSASQAIFGTSTDSMLNLDPEGVIESVNDATVKTFGYPQDQILGQHIKIIIPTELSENDDFYAAYDAFLNCERNEPYRCSAKAVKDGGHEFPVSVILFQFWKSDKSRTSFATIFRDQTADLQRETEIAMIKKQSEKLMLENMPTEIISKAMLGHEQISFRITCGTIAFLDIGNILAYSESMAPATLLKNLGMIFTTYDTLLKKYVTLNKIRIIGSCYMVAGGLFDEDTDPVHHARQAISFALDCVNAIERISQEMKMEIVIKTGISTGGPISAGVLGDQFPVFEIVGEPIAVAQKLKDTCNPGLIHISASTEKHMDCDVFKIQEDREIEFKHGKEMTFHVHPPVRIESASEEQFSADDTAEIQINYKPMTPSFRESREEVVPKQPSILLEEVI